MKNLDKGYHCVYHLNHRPVLVTEYSRDVITDTVSNKLCDIQSQGGGPEIGYENH